MEDDEDDDDDDDDDEEGEDEEDEEDSEDEEVVELLPIVGMWEAAAVVAEEALDEDTAGDFAAKDTGCTPLLRPSSSL